MEEVLNVRAVAASDARGLVVPRCLVQAHVTDIASVLDRVIVIVLHLGRGWIFCNIFCAIWATVLWGTIVAAGSNPFDVRLRPLLCCR